MKRRILAFVCPMLFSATSLGQACLLPGATQIPSLTVWGVGPAVFAAATGNPLVATAIFTARDAWDVTDAVNRFGAHGATSASDCPMGLGLQVGAYSFSGTPCGTATAYGFNTFPSVLAFVDYFPSVCVGCGTQSMSVNLDWVWSVNGSPLPGEYELADIMTHEFGHMLGLAHMAAGVCGGTSTNSCAATPGRETMQPQFWDGPGETCNSTLETNDINSANAFY